MRLPFPKCAICHLQTVGHRKRCDESHETAFHEMCNATHFLLVIAKNVMFLPLTKCATSLTAVWWSEEKMWWDCLSPNVQCNSLPVSHRKRCDEAAFHKICNVTHKLLVIAKDVMRLPFTTCTMSLTSFGNREDVMRLPFTKCAMLLTSFVHSKRCDETNFHKMCNVTHSLLVTGKYVMRLPFTRCAMSLTRCWS